MKIDVSETEYVEFKALLVQLYISVFDLVNFLPVLHDMSISTRHESILIIRIVCSAFSLALLEIDATDLAQIASISATSISFAGFTIHY